MLAREGRHFCVAVLFTHAKSTKNMVFFMVFYYLDSI